MGRHSQTSSVSTTLAGLGMLAQRSISPSARSGHGRRRAEGSAHGSVAPVMLRAGGGAAVLALAVSGGAYAAVSAAGPDVRPLTEKAAHVQAIGAAPTASPSATAQASEAAATTIETVTEETEDPYDSTKEETAAIPEGKTEVKTQGVNGKVRTTYQVTRQGGKEISREAVSVVVIAERVDEVISVGTGKGVTPTGAPDPTGAKAIAKSLLAQRGWGDDQFACLDRLWTRESNWRYNASNPSSGAYGIPQALPGSKMGSVAADWQTNPTTQITWGLGYIAGRYGNPCGAWAHSQATGWY